MSLLFHELLYASTDALAIGVSSNKFTKKDMIPWLDPEWWTLICIRPCGHLPVFLMSPMGQDNKKTIRYNLKLDIFFYYLFPYAFYSFSYVRQPVWSCDKK